MQISHASGKSTGIKTFYIPISGNGNAPEWKKSTVDNPTPTFFTNVNISLKDDGYVDASGPDSNKNFFFTVVNDQNQAVDFPIPGLSLSNTGFISGNLNNINSIGMYNLRIKATNTAGSTTGPLQIEVKPNDSLGDVKVYENASLPPAYASNEYAGGDLNTYFDNQNNKKVEQNDYLIFEFLNKRGCEWLTLKNNDQGKPTILSGSVPNNADLNQCTDVEIKATSKASGNFTSFKQNIIIQKGPVWKKTQLKNAIFDQVYELVLDDNTSGEAYVIPAAPGNVMTLSFTENKPDWMQSIEKATYSRIIGSAPPTVNQINDAYNTSNPVKYTFNIEATDQTGSTAPDLEVSVLPNSSLIPPAWKKNVDNNNLPLPQATKGKAYDPIDLYNYVSRSLKAGAEVANDELFFRLNTPVNCPWLVITDSRYLSSNGIVLPGDAPSTCDIQISVYSRAYGLHSPTDPVKGNPATAQLQTDETQYSAIFTPTLSIHAGTNPEWTSNEIQIEPSNTGTIYNAFNIHLSPYVAKPTKPNGNYEVIFINKNGFDLALDEEAPKGSSSKWHLIPEQNIDLESLVGQTMTISLGLRDRNTGGTSEVATIRIPVTSTNDIEFRWASVAASLSMLNNPIL